MVKKNFTTYNTVRDNALLLGKQIYEDGFIPDVIYISLRGGAYLGNVISEYFKIVRKNERPVFYAAVVARSYVDIQKNEKVMVDGWTYDPAYLRHGDKVLLIDDIFDSGRTINHLANIILGTGIPRSDLKIAVHDYKHICYTNDVHDVVPDYYCRKFDVMSPEDEVWIHYMSHELQGLTSDEIAEYYNSRDDVYQTLTDLIE